MRDKDFLGGDGLMFGSLFGAANGLMGGLCSGQVLSDYERSLCAPTFWRPDSYWHVTEAHRAANEAHAQVAMAQANERRAQMLWREAMRARPTKVNCRNCGAPNLPSLEKPCDWCGT